MVVFPHKFDAVLLGWGLSPTPDPYLFWHSESDKKGGFNLVGYHNKKILFLYIPNSITAVNKKIKHIEPTLGGIWHNYISWEKE